MRSLSSFMPCWSWPTFSRSTCLPYGPRSRRAAAPACPAGSAMLELYDRLTDGGRADRFEIESGGSLELLGDLLMAFQDHIELVRGQGDFPATDDFRSFFTANQLPAWRMP